MTKKTKIMLIFSHIAILSVGFAVGLYSSFTKDAKEVMRMSSQAAIISHYGLLVDTQRNEGDRDAYKKALLKYLGVLEEIFKQPTALFDAKSTSVDKMLIFERLSRLEREAGNEKASKDYMNSAIQTCGNTGWKDCSMQNISAISRKLEAQGMIPPKSSKSETNQSKH